MGERENFIYLRLIFFVIPSFTIYTWKKTVFSSAHSQNHINCSETSQASRASGHMQGWWCHLGMCKNAVGVECAPKCISELCLWDRATDSLRRQQQPCPWDGTSDAGRSSNPGRVHVVTSTETSSVGAQIWVVRDLIAPGGYCVPKFFAK